jgi:beta-phosphoglucomutase
MKTRAVLWDLDGVLVDSAPHHFQSWRETLDRECRRDFTPDEFKHSFGMRNDTMLRELFGPQYPDAEVARLSAIKEQRYRDLVRASGIAALPGVRACLDYLRGNGWRQVVASSAPRANIDVVLAALGLGVTFDALVAAEDVQHGKPAPDVFVTAALRAGTDRRRCVVVEDSPAGVEAARRAGIACIGVLTTHARLDVAPVFKSLAEMPLDTFERLVLPAHHEAQSGRV